MPPGECVTTVVFFSDWKIGAVLETREYLSLLAPGSLNDRPNSFNPVILFGYGDRNAPQAARKSGAIDEIDANRPCQGQMEGVLESDFHACRRGIVRVKSAKIFIAQLVEHLTTPSRLSSEPIVRYLANPMVTTAPNVIGTLHNFHPQIVPMILGHQNPRPSPASDKYLNLFAPCHC